MSSFQRFDGTETTENDPKRLIWAGIMPCTFWTDDWSLLEKTSTGIPVCPYCGKPGFTTVAGSWYKDAKKMDLHNPKYLKFLEVTKNKCNPNKTVYTQYLEWVNGQR